MSLKEANNLDTEYKGEILFYQTEDGQTKIDVKVIDQSVWLTQYQMMELFNSSRTNIIEHIANIYLEGELSEEATCRKFRQVQMEGSRQVSRELSYYNLDVIISVGYRVKSLRGTQFRIWATERLREYIIKGFTINDELLKNGGKSDYFEELLARIRDIRSSEKIFYKKVLDIFSTSIDYDSHSEVCIEFFKIVQNKFHYAAHGHTASELIYKRVDAKKPNMGLTNFEGKITKAQTHRAKNYLSEEELERLNRMVTIYLEFSELQAMNKKAMYMQDHLTKVDEILKMTGGEILNHAGSVSTDLLVRECGI